MTVYRIHAIGCKYIPQKENLEQKRDKDIQQRIAKANAKKKQEKKKFLFFMCPFDGCMQTYFSFRYQGALDHLQTCQHKNDEQRLKYMKEKKLLA